VGQFSVNWPIIVLAGLAGLAGLLAACLARARIRGGDAICDAIAAGVLVGLLVGLVPRLTGAGSILLARSLPVVQPAEARGLAASIGPLVIQNLAAALVIGAYLVALRSQRGRAHAETAEQRTAPLFASALGVHALADGLAGAAGSMPVPTPLTFGLVAGVVLGHLCRGVALGSGNAARGYDFSWLVFAAVLGGLLNSLGASMGRQLGFDLTTLIAVPVAACAVVLLVVSVAMMLGPGLGSNLRRLPAPGFLAGLGLTLIAARLLGSSPL
jgi:hypothetical protein